MLLLATNGYSQKLSGTITPPTPNLRQELRFLTFDTVIIASIDLEEVDREPFRRYAYNGNEWLSDGIENIRLSENSTLTDYQVSCDGKTLVTLSIIEGPNTNSSRVTAKIEVYKKPVANWILVQELDSLDLRINGNFLSLRYSLSADGETLAMIEIDGAAPGSDDQASILTVYDFDTNTNKYGSVYADTSAAFRIWRTSIDISGNGQTIAVGRKVEATDTLSIYDKQNSQWAKTEVFNVNNNLASVNATSLPSISDDGNLISFVKNPAPWVTGESFVMVYDRQAQQIDSILTRGPGIGLGAHKMTEQGNRLVSTHDDVAEILQDTAQYYSMLKYENGEWVKEFTLAYDVLPI